MKQRLSWTLPRDRRATDQELFVIGCGYDIIDESDVVRNSVNTEINFHILNVIKGNISIFMKDKEYNAKAGDLVFFHSDIPYKYIYHSNPETVVYWLHFSGRRSKETVEELGFIDSFVTHAGSDLSEYFEKIIEEVSKKSKHYNKMMTGNLLLLLAEIVRCTETVMPELNKIIALMKNAKYKDLSIDDYARMCNVSKSQFIRNFKKYTGKTPVKFKNDTAISAACNLLTKTSLSITEISSELGFDNIYYFSTIFKKHTGISPAEYRKQFKNL